MLQTDRDLLVCIFQRGAADGLNAVVPYGDPEYYAKRSTINVPKASAIDLDGFFGLHPALAPLKPIYDLGDLALVHATGEPHGSRSHFTAQGLVERGVLEKTGPNTGWLARHMNNSPAASSSAFRMVCISGNVMVSLLGADEPLAISNLNDFGFDQEVIDSGYLDILGSLYHSTVPFQGPAQAALAAIGELHAADIASFVPENGAVYPTSALGPKLFQAGQLIKSSLPVEVICIDSDGWDHHENLPTYIDQSLTELAGSLAAFYTDMGPARMQRITVLVHTEFGRRVAENGSKGADHGTGSLAYLMGGGVNGGQVFRNWPGLADGDLEMGEDLKITTDLRSVLAEMLSKRMVGADISDVFPGFTGPFDLGMFSS
jgi:uncharacterized protein (DUF1501 family)